MKFTIESFDIVAVCGDKVECCFDVVAGADRALDVNRLDRQEDHLLERHPFGQAYSDTHLRRSCRTARTVSSGRHVDSRCSPF